MGWLLMHPVSAMGSVHSILERGITGMGSCYPVPWKQREGGLSSPHLPLGDSLRGSGQESCQSTAVSGVRVN